MSFESIFTYENIQNIGISIGIFLLFLLVRKLFTKYIFSIVLRITRKVRIDFMTQILLAFERPIQNMFMTLGVVVAMVYFPFLNYNNPLFLTIVSSLFIIQFAWGLYNLAASSSILFARLNERYNFDVDNILIPLISKGLRFVIVAITFTVVLQEFGYEISGFVAGLGLGGLAISLAAKDMLANMFGGFVIIIEKPFRIGEWILTQSVEGTVEEITFRSTKIRTFADALVTVPNATLANESITNWSRMEKRQVSFSLRLSYETSREKVEQIVRQIDYLLKNHSEVHQDTIMVNFDQYKDNGMDIFIYFFTNTTVWSEYLNVKEEINLKILDLLREEDVAVALPARKLYLDSESDNHLKDKSHIRGES